MPVKLVLTSCSSKPVRFQISSEMQRMEPNTGVRILQLTLANNIIFTLINPTFQPFNVKSQVNSIPVLLCADSNDHMTLCLYISLYGCVHTARELAKLLLCADSNDHMTLCLYISLYGCVHTARELAKRSDAKRGEATPSEAKRQGRD